MRQSSRLPDPADGDGAAEVAARELSTSGDSPVVIRRLADFVDWAYVTEVDERS